MPVTRPDVAAATVAAYQAQAVALRAQIEQFIALLWQSLGTYRNTQMADFIGQAVPMVAGAQQQMSNLTAAYLGERLGKPVGVPDPARVTGPVLRNGTPMDEVYGRPFHLVWRDLHDGKTPPTAIESGLKRAVNLAQTDLQLAKTHTSQQVLQTNTNVVGYRRVLEGPHSCGLCIVASTQRYHTAKLLPIHPGCDCSVEPIVGGEPNELVIHPALLSDVHQEIADRFGQANYGARVIDGQVNANGEPLTYKDVLIEHHHTELGPVLGVRGQDFHDLNSYAA